MPALGVVLVLVAANELGPGFVAGHVGGDHRLAVSPDFVGFRQDGGDQHRARVAQQRGVVIVERMRGDAVEQGEIGGRRLHAVQRPVRAIAADVSEPARGDVADWLGPARHHDSDTIGEAQADGLDAIGRQRLETQPGNELTDLSREAHQALLESGQLYHGAAVALRRAPLALRRRRALSCGTGASVGRPRRENARASEPKIERRQLADVLVGSYITCGQIGW